MSGDGQLEVRGVGRMLESFAASPRAVRRGRVQIHPQWSDALYAPRLRLFERPELSSDITLGASGGFGISVVSAMFTMAGTVSAFGVYSEAPAIIAGIVSGAMAIGSAAVSAIAIPKVRRSRVRMAQAIASDFGAWAKARYGLELSAETLDSLVEFVAYPKAASAQKTFEHHGHAFKVVAHGGKFYIEQQRDVSVLDYVASSPLAIEAEGALKQLRELPGEAGLLGERLLELLALSVDEELNVEQDHVLRRVRADAVQVISLHAKLVKLQALDAENETALRDTVASLTGEVDDIIQQWRQEVRNEVAVQRDYVRERRLHAPARLMLPKGTDTSELAPAVEA